MTVRSQSLSPGAAPRLDVAFCREYFPGLSSDWTYLDNAGGSLVAQPVIARMNDFMSFSKNQPYPHFHAGKLAYDRIEESYQAIAQLINSRRDEIVIAASTTANVYMLAHALRPQLKAGDEIILTEQDHESNNGAWRRLAEFGVVIREWKVDPASGMLVLADMEALLSERTKIVCFTHVSNVVGAINPVSEITAIAHSVGAKVVVDGVAYAGHGLVDVKAWDVDFYLFSLYKLFGPHLGVLYGKREEIEKAANQNHFFYENSIPEKLHPAGDQYEVVGGVAGIADYFDAVYTHHFNRSDDDFHTRAGKVFSLMEVQEDILQRQLMDFLTSRQDLKVLGPTTGSRFVRMPTIAFAVKGRSSRQFAEEMAEHRVAIAYGSFYSRRCLAALGVEDMSDGLARISLLHYNSTAEMDRTIDVMKKVLGRA